MVILHVMASLIAILTGIGIFIRGKGTRWHRRVGYVYIGAMYVLYGVSFGISEMTGTISVQNIMLVTVGFLLLSRLQQRMDNRYTWYIRCMAYSYINLFVTGLIQFFEYLPIPNPVARALIFIVMPILIGGYWIEFRTLPVRRGTGSPGSG